MSDSNNRHYDSQISEPGVYGWLKNFVKEHKEKPTLAESILWEKLRGKGLDGHKFRRQHIIDQYIADFVCLRKRLIIEVDGLIHQVPENKINDEARTIELNFAGFEVLRFTNEEIINNTGKVLSKILDSLRERHVEEPETKNPPLEGREASSLRGAGSIFISLPGVPHEMKGLMMDEVIPRLLKEFEMPAIVHRTVFTAGQGESILAELLKEFEPSLPPQTKLAYLPNYGMVKLRLTSRGNNKEEVEKELLPYFEKLQVLVKEYLVTNEDEGLETVIGKILKAKGKTMATAESCTGGYIAHLITAIPGSSAYFKGSVVAYAYEAKENVLGVKHATLEKAGAVSAETVIEMLQGVIDLMQVDYGLAVSGIMGPDGGTEEKPVGTVWIAAGDKQNIETLQLNLRFDRQRNISITAGNALNFLRKFIIKN